MQIGCVESPLASFMEKVWVGMVLQWFHIMIALQAPLDSTRGALHVPTDTRTFISPWKILH